MEAFVHNGDFDFGVFGYNIAEPEPKVEKKRKERDPEEKRPANNQYNESQQKTPQAKRQHIEKDVNQVNGPKGGFKQANNHGDNIQDNLDKGNIKAYNKESAAKSNKWDTKGYNNNKGNKGHNDKEDNKEENKTANNNNKDNTNKKQVSKQGFDSKEAWEPDASDIANTIKVERGESIFLGEFSDTGLTDRIVSTVTNNMKMAQPTVIQHHGIPQILEGHDALIKAETGSGKTLTYVLPLLDVLGQIEPKIKREVGTHAIILAPTRELVSQIYDVVLRLAKTYIWLVPGYLSGGENKESEKSRLRRGVTVLVSTPGRLIDHLQTTSCFKYHQLRFLVLDEADRLLDMGLGPQVAEIVQHLKERCSYRYSDMAEPKPFERKAGTHLNKTDLPVPVEAEKPKLNKTIKFEYDDAPAKKNIVLQGKKFQTVMASATLHNGIRQLAFVALHKPVYVGLVPLAVAVPTKKKREDIEKGQTYNTPTNLSQFYALVRTKDRTSSLVMFLQERIKEDTKVIIFVASCAAVNFFFHVLSEATADTGVIPAKKRLLDDKAVSLTETENRTLEQKPLVSAPVFRLHGDLTQLDRHQATTKFRSAKNGIMFATDVAARGLDFPDLDWIVQFDPPADTKDYIHRVGRTARIGRKGQSLLYITPEEKEYLTYLSQFGIELEAMRLPGDIITQRLIEQYVRHNSHAYITAKNAYIAAVRAYATHTAATKYIFNVANLHVGHLAMSYCLHDKPTFLKSAAANERAARDREKEKVKSDRAAEKAFRNSFKKNQKSEFEAGF